MAWKLRNECIFIRRLHHNTKMNFQQLSKGSHLAGAAKKLANFGLFSGPSQLQLPLFRYRIETTKHNSVVEIRV